MFEASLIQLKQLVLGLLIFLIKVTQEICVVTVLFENKC